MSFRHSTEADRTLMQRSAAVLVRPAAPPPQQRRAPGRDAQGAHHRVRRSMRPAPWLCIVGDAWPHARAEFDHRSCSEPPLVPTRAPGARTPFCDVIGDTRLEWVVGHLSAAARGERDGAKTLDGQAAGGIGRAHSTCATLFRFFLNPFAYAWMRTSQQRVCACTQPQSVRQLRNCRVLHVGSPWLFALAVFRDAVLQYMFRSRSTHILESPSMDTHAIGDGERQAVLREGHVIKYNFRSNNSSGRERVLGERCHKDQPHVQKKPALECPDRETLTHMCVPSIMLCVATPAVQSEMCSPTVLLKPYLLRSLLEHEGLPQPTTHQVQRPGLGGPITMTPLEPTRK